jgi:hypothetical protein
VTKTAVYIATTNGPVRVELISQEDIARSIVVKSADFVPLADIAEEYQHFVSGNGPVARAFGPFDPPMFSMELSAEIESGRSWHLAAFIAHGLAAENRLAGPKDEPEAVVWATGVMGNNFSVAAEHIGLKIEHSRALFKETTSAGIALHVVVPDGSLDEADHVPLATHHHVSDARAALQSLNVTSDGALSAMEITASTDRANQAPTSKKWRRAWIIGGISALILAIVTENTTGWIMTEMLNLSPEKPTMSVALAETTEKQGIQPTPLEQNVVVQLDEIRASSDTSCAAVHFRGGLGNLVPVQMNGKGVGADSAGGGLCGIQISLSSAEQSSVERVSIETAAGNFVGHSSNSFNLAPVSKGSWKLFVPRTFKTPIVYKIRLVTRAGSDVSISHKVMP